MELTINIKEESKVAFFIQLLKELKYVELINPPVSYFQEEYLTESEVQEEIVAYTVDGKPLNKEEYLNEVLEAEKEIEEGNYIEHEDLKKEIKKWRK